MKPILTDDKTLEFNLLQQIIGNYYNLPIEFCLREFLGWENAKIKEFLKEHKKAKKIALKSEKRDIFSNSCCAQAQSN
jgi:hypothetical protein